MKCREVNPECLDNHKESIGIGGYQSQMNVRLERLLLGTLLKR